MAPLTCKETGSQFALETTLTLENRYVSRNEGLGGRNRKAHVDAVNVWDFRFQVIMDRHNDPLRLST